MASNIQRGTRGLSAGDWVRLKRLNGARTFKTDVTTNPAPRTEVETGRRVYTEVGGSKIRRPASSFTDYIASQKADYVLETSAGECGVARDLTINKLCTCDTSSAIKHNGLCRSCTHDRIVNRSGGCKLGTNENCAACGDTCPAGYDCVYHYIKDGDGYYACELTA